MLCREACIVKYGPDAIRMATLFCRSWTCEICAPKRAAQVSGRLQAGKPNKFLTLTVNPAVYSGPIERADRLATAFRKWIRKMRLRFKGQEVEYYAVFERTAQGEPHLHVLGRWPFVAQAEISDFFKAEIRAPIVDIRRVRSKRGASRYVSKYLSKDCQKFGKLKRYFQSRGYCEPLVKTPDEPPWNRIKWEKVEKPLWWLCWHYRVQGWEWIDHNRLHYHEWRRPPPEPPPEPPRPSPWVRP